jgi:hypothetical protein
VPVTSLFSLFRARGWGQQSEQQVNVIYLAASSSATAVITPSAPYNAMVVHLITVNRFLPNAFTVTVSQREVGQHTVTLSADLAEVSFWAWVTAADPLQIVVTNRLAFNGFVGLTLSTNNFDTIQQMAQVRKLATTNFPLLEGTIVPGPAGPPGR